VIDVWGVVANSLWILGLTVLLACLSWANWAAASEGQRLRAVLARPAVGRAVDAGLLLFCAGLAATARSWWERALWCLLALWWAVQAWLAIPRKESGKSGRTS